MKDYHLVEAEVVHDELDHVLVDRILAEAVGVLEAVQHNDDHFLYPYVEVQHLSVRAGHLYAVARYAVV